MSCNELPKGWGWARLRDVAPEDRQPCFDSTLPYLGLDAIEAHTGRIIESGEPPGTALTFAYDARHILYGKLRPYLNKVALPETRGRCTTEAIPLRPREDIERRFVAAFLRSRNAVDAICGSTTGSRMPRADMEVVSGLPVPLPALPEQRRIADAIDAAMAEANLAARATGVQADDLARLEFRIFEDAFPVRPVALDIADEAPEGWTWQPLTSVARLESGHTPSRRHPEWWGGNTPWIALPDIRAFDGATACETLETINDGGLANSSARLLPTGTVCLSRTASVGFVTVMGRPMATSQDFVNWVSGPKLDFWFLAYALMAARSWIRELASGATHKTIYMPTLKALRICLPEPRRQVEIVGQIERCRAELRNARAALTAQQAAISALPAAILSAAFEGQL